MKLYVSLVPLCFVMGSLSKALKIVWAKPNEFEGTCTCISLLEGDMHLPLSVISGIGYLYHSMVMLA